MNPKQFLAALRRLKLSQRRAAVVLEVEPSTIYRWAHGERTIPGPVAVALRTMIALESCRQELQELQKQLRTVFLHESVANRILHAGKGSRRAT